MRHRIIAVIIAAAALLGTAGVTASAANASPHVPATWYHG